MINLGSWMNGILIGWGIDPKIANTFDEMIIAALLVILAIGLDYLCQAIFVGSMKSSRSIHIINGIRCFSNVKLSTTWSTQYRVSWSMPCCLWRLYGGKVCCFCLRKYVLCISCSLCYWR